MPAVTCSEEMLKFLTELHPYLIGLGINEGHTIGTPAGELLTLLSNMRIYDEQGKAILDENNKPISMPVNMHMRDKQGKAILDENNKPTYMPVSKNNLIGKKINLDGITEKFKELSLYINDAHDSNSEQAKELRTKIQGLKVLESHAIDNDDIVTAQGESAQKARKPLGKGQGSDKNLSEGPRSQVKTASITSVVMREGKQTGVARRT